MPKRTQDKDAAEILAVADDLLADLGALQEAIEDCMADYAAELDRVKARYEAKLEPLNGDKAAQEKAITSLMKKSRGSIFAAGDVVNLAHGSLVRNEDDHVTIPRDALAKCKEQGFTDVIKIAESLDREAVEKWTDAKLLLIGAERKSMEKFSYNIKDAK